MYLSPNQADEEFGPVPSAIVGWLFALTGCAGLGMAYLFLFGAWRQPGSYGIAAIAAVVSFPCLLIGFRALVRGPSSLEVRPATLRGLAIFCYLVGAAFLVLAILGHLPWRQSAGFILEFVAFGTLGWQVAKRRQARSFRGSETLSRDS